MPCNSDYMEPTGKERQLQRTAKLIIFLRHKTGQPIESWIHSAAENCYCSREDLVPILCADIKALTPSQEEQIVYDAHNKSSRDLASWWEEHQKADRARIREEQKQKRLMQVKQKALAKLSPEERRALEIE